MHSLPRILAFAYVVAAIAASAEISPSAEASVLRVDNDIDQRQTSVSYVADPGELNRANVRLVGRRLEITDVVPIQLPNVDPDTQLLPPDCRYATPGRQTSVVCQLFFRPQTSFEGEPWDGFVVDGGDRSDSLTVPRDALVIDGPGNDRVTATGPVGWLNGSGNDTFRGSPASDVTRTVSDTTPRIRASGLGDDLVFGNGGNDWLNAGAGRDRVFGGLGNDLLSGGAGFDRVYGGPGIDRIDGVRDDFRAG